MMSIQSTVPVVPQKLDELLALQDQAFVRGAYLALMGREADAEGLGYYLGRLRGGHSKLALLDQLAKSKEARSHGGVHLPGLKPALGRYRRGQLKVVGWLFRRLEGTEGNSPSERRLRVVEQLLAQLLHQSADRFEALDGAVASLREALASGMSADGPRSKPVEEASGEFLIMATLSPRSRHLFRELQEAVTLKDAGQS